MATITVIEHISTDGVMQGPGRAGEDPRRGFAHSGWASPYTDEVSMRVAGEGMGGEGALLLGRRSYELLRESWSGRSDNPFSPVLDARHKYVVSDTLTGELPWANSTRVANDGVAALKSAAPEGALAVIGSGVLVRALLAADLVDVLQLSVYPLLLGAGTRLFADAGPLHRLELADSVTTSTGVIIATYHRGHHR